MKKFLMILCAVMLVFGMATSSSATSIYYEATGVSGVGTVTYGINNGIYNSDGTYGINNTINNAPVFSFTAPSGSVDENLALFVAGEYTISFTLNGFWADYNEDDVVDSTLPNTSFTSGPYTLPALSLSGTYGQLTWNFHPYSGGWASYDFGTTGTYTNAGINTLLANFDPNYNGVMNANIGWDKLRVELNSPAPVPEPSTILLLGLGLIGMVGYGRKRFSKKG